MSRSLSSPQAILLGLVVLLGLGLAGVGLFAVGSRQLLWDDTFCIQVGFKQIHGVDRGTRVRVQGIEAGEVAEVRLPREPGGEVMLKLRLAGRFRELLRADARVQILSENLISGKVIDIDPGTQAAGPVQENQVIRSAATADVADLLAQANTTLQKIQNGQGTLGKLANDPEAYDRLVQFVKQGNETLASFQQGADAVNRLPFVRNYVQDARKILVRPECERYRQWFAERDLFEPNQAVLTAQGRQKLDELAPWLNGLKHKGSDVVVTSYSGTDLNDRVALTVSQKQADTICKYLIDKHKVDKMGLLSWRKVTPLGCGSNAPPVPDKEKLPRPRVEVLVFVPQG